MDPNSLPDGMLSMSLSLTSTPARRRNPTGFQRERRHSSLFASQRTSPNDSAQFSGSLPADRRRCTHCDQSIDRDKEYACATCNSWPACGECILEHHLGACATFKVMVVLKQRLSLINSWLAHIGETCRKIINAQYKLLETSLSNAAAPLDRVTSMDDIRIRQIVQGHLLKAEERRREYAEALEMFKEFKSIVLDLNRYADLNSPPQDEDVPVLELLDLANAKVESVIDKFDDLSSEGRTTAAEDITRRLNNLARLFRVLPPAKTEEEPPTGSGERKGKSTLTRSKSFHTHNNQ